VATDGLMRLEALAAVPTGDHASEQIGPLPGSAHAKAPGPIVGLRGVPEVAGHDSGHRPVDDNALPIGPLHLAPFCADLRVPGLGIDERAPIHRIPEDRPDGALGPGGNTTAPQGPRRWDATLIEPMGDRRVALSPVDAGLEDILHEGGLGRIGDQGDAFALRLPPAGLQDPMPPLGLVDRSAVAIRRRPPGPVAALGMGPEPACHHLGELLRVLMREDALETLHQVPGDAPVIGSGLVRIDDADAGASQRVLVERRLFGVQK
jgi:hypothetical protein